MNRLVNGRLLAVVITSLPLFHGSAFAQLTETKPAGTAPAATPTAEAKKEEVVVLSPFRVSAEKDEGFVATSALAGGRLNTELKNTPVAYSVLTRDFLDALTLTDQD